MSDEHPPTSFFKDKCMSDIGFKLNTPRDW